MASHKQAGNVALSSGNPIGAIEEYTKGVEQVKKETPTLARFEGEGGKSNDGAKASEAELLFAALLSNRSVAFGKVGKWPEALADAEVLVRVRPDWAKAWGRKGDALVGLGRPDEASRAFEQAGKCEDGAAIAEAGAARVRARIQADEANVLGEEASNKGKHAAAETHFLRSIKADPSIALVHSNLAHSLCSLGRYEEAAAEAAKVVALAPQWHTGFRRQAQILTAQRRYEEALPYFAHAVSLKPDMKTLSTEFNQCRQEAFNEQKRKEAEAAAASAASPAEKEGEGPKKISSKKK
jgi:tetratricopeptide (TPR) repeat protein